MQDFDTILKQLLHEPDGEAVRYITGHRVVSWRNVEMPTTRNLRADSIGKDEAARSIQIECQTHNDPKMAARMLNYGAWMFAEEGRFPLQYVLYIGRDAMSMPTVVEEPDQIRYMYQLVNMKDLDGEPLMASPQVGDNILAVLMRLRDQREAVRTILERIAEQPAGERRTAYKQLLTLAGLRELGEFVKEEGRRMFVLEDYLQHDVFGPLVQQGLELGLEQGLEQGRHKEALDFLHMIVERLGSLPESLSLRYAAMSTAEIREESKRALSARSIDDLLN